MSQDQLALVNDHLRTVGLICIPSLVEPIRGSESLCLLDAGAGVQLRVFRIPFGLQRHCPDTALPVVVVVVLQSHGRRHFDPLAVPY
jgi:hypothetical protein